MWAPNRALARLIVQWKDGNPGKEVVYTIADDKHSSTSDHAVDADGTVDAGDFMAGATVTQGELDTLAETLRLNRDSRIKYVIRRQRIFYGNDGPTPWKWRSYSGKYHSHTHVSTREANEDDGRDWNLKRKTIGVRVLEWEHFKVAMPILKEGDSDSDFGGYDRIRRIQRLLGITVDGDWGPATSKALGVKVMTVDLWCLLLGLGKE